MAGGRLNFYNLIAKILIDGLDSPEGLLSALRRDRRCVSLREDTGHSRKFHGGSAKKGVRIIRGVINFPSEFGSRREVRIIRGCGLYAVKDTTIILAE